jgi:PAS domain S-box-containing protein
MRSRHAFRNKLRLLVLLAAVAPQLLATYVLLSDQRAALRGQAVDNALSTARLMGGTTVAALVFGDAEAAQENLAALGTRPEIAGAAVYRQDGSTFATYRRSGVADPLPPRAQPRGFHFDEGRLILSEPLTLRGETVGSVLVAADAADIATRLKRHAVKLALVLFASTALVGGLAITLERALTRPLTRLATAAQQISERQDYSVRVPVTAEDELGALTAAFNQMLSQIEERDAALLSARDRLEQRVRDRVADLQREVQERREVERALRDSQHKLSDILEHSTNLFFAHGPDHVVTYVSPQVRQFLDCEPEEALRHWNAFVPDTPGNRLGFEHKVRALVSGQRQPPYEVELESRTGRRLWVEVNEAPVVRDGRAMAIVGALTDITDRRRAEQDRARLEQEVRQAHKMEAVGRLAGGIAHDFNNLLGVIQGYAALVRRRMSQGDPSLHKVDEIVKASERAAALTRQLLAFSRRQVVAPKVLSVGAVVSEMESILRRLIREDVHLSVTAPEPCRIRADRSQIEQVLLNLAVNARDAMPDGGTLSIDVGLTQLTEEQVRAHRLPPGRYVRMAVSDTGCGMDAQVLSHIFEPFFTTKEVGAGTGLGLATVYGVVQQSGGAVEVTSEPGRGSTFSVYLPELEGAEEERRSPHVPLRPGRETVMVVEDEPSLRELTREVLEAQGYQVLEAGTGAEALAILRAHQGPLDLLMTDVIMPGLSGRQLVEQVRAERPRLPVLYMSGYTADVIAQSGVLGAAIHLLEKPFTPDGLVRRVQAVLAAKGSRD